MTQQTLTVAQALQLATQYLQHAQSICEQILKYDAKNQEAHSILNRINNVQTKSDDEVFGEPSQRYFQYYYDTHLWKRVFYRGVRTLKSVTDMWNYQEILSEHDIQWVIETGSRHGGSALFFSDILTAKNATGKVISVDYAPELDSKVLNHPNIIFLKGDSANAELVKTIFSDLLPSPATRGKIFLILDSDHSQQHVLRELQMYVPYLNTGDYLIVEDTCINGHPVRPDFGPGPWEAVEEFLNHHPNLLTHDRERENKFGFTFAPRGFFVKL